ncbi:hypothetical protein EV193_101244 [Herbihabitans rhizosphaerae]|uniref:Outer membrane lipoprotein-sorting protein n=1 Tax=Herbihabitans rhizosphaerae TaxID=1872711 RepID=A0A4Q7L421_9PSEU|nr:outer membrane lipoprotein carrier protein LolA [Herbihabitans rhizosphaerae]RZS44369.1 hypothetical protein EV193_101244 [Herbihabitans rhizosphaerae]
MNRRKTALAAAAVGTVTGVAGLVVLATPAGAGAPPTLPPTSAEALVESVMKSDVPALAGAVQVDNDLGLPVPMLPGKSDTPVRVWSDGAGKFKVSVPSGNTERTIVNDGTTMWTWNSADKSVTKGARDHKDVTHPTVPGQEKINDPTAFAKELVGAMREDSTVSVDGTAEVADRAAYELVLTPKPTERTLLREIRVSIDAEKRIPLRLDVLANGQAKPALRVGFSEVTFGAQDPAHFTFTPPPGTTVTERDAGKAPKDPKKIEDLIAKANPQVVGKGWDTSLVARIPAELIAEATKQGQAKGAKVDPMALLRQFGKQVKGSYGDGWLIGTKVGNLLVTNDGRVAIGAVPEQVLTEALGQVK